MKTLNLFSLKGKVAVVTGGCGNLGPWWVKALLEAGGKVAVIDLPSISPPEILKDLVKKYQSFLKIYRADVTDLKSLSRAHSLVKKELGFVDILVNNAGIDAPPIKSFGGKIDREKVREKYRQMWQVNVQGIVNCLEEFVLDMKERKWGSIINIGSLYLERAPYEGLYDHLGFDKPWAYGATKAAVHQVTRHFATRLAKYGVRVNTLSPGGVLGRQDEEFIKKYSARVPLARMAEKEKDLAGPLVFLASDASSYVTGINLQVNGGYTAW